MAKRSILFCAFAFFGIAMLSVGCKKGCGACKSYGSNSTSYLAPYSSQVCYGNFCACPNGLEGDSCQTYSVNKYLQPSATWIASDACSGSSSYYVSMSSSSSYPYTVIYINGLFNMGSFVEADLASSPNNTSTTLNIPTQTIGGNTFYGSGTYSSIGSFGRITLNLDYTNSAGLEFPCTVTLSQQ